MRRRTDRNEASCEPRNNTLGRVRIMTMRSLFALVLASVAGCSPTQPPSSSLPPSPTPPVESSATATTSPTTPAPSPSQTLTADEAAAEDALLGYFHHLDLMRQNPSKQTYEATLEWVTPIQKESVTNSYEYFSKLEGGQVGFVHIRGIEWGDVEVIDGQKFIDVTFCQDATETTLVTDKETIAPVYPTLLTTGQVMETAGGWRVVQLLTGDEVKSC